MTWLISSKTWMVRPFSCWPVFAGSAWNHAARPSCSGSSLRGSLSDHEKPVKLAGWIIFWPRITSSNCPRGMLADLWQPGVHNTPRRMTFGSPASSCPNIQFSKRSVHSLSRAELKAISSLQVLSTYTFTPLLPGSRGVLVRTLDRALLESSNPYHSDVWQRFL